MELVLLYSVFRIAPRTVEVLVELPGGLGGSRQGGYLEARIVLAPAALRPWQDFGLGDHPAPTRPAFAGALPERPETPRRPARGHSPRPGAAHRGRDPLLQAAVAGGWSRWSTKSWEMREGILAVRFAARRKPAGSWWRAWSIVVVGMVRNSWSGMVWKVGARCCQACLWWAMVFIR